MSSGSVTIPRTPVLPAGMDYLGLRREAIGDLSRLGSRQWTDYNTHDPGITLLEALLYTITDLSYRSRWEIRDLLVNAPAQPFPTAREVLTANPVTPDDYRRLLIDLDGVRNAWLACKQCACGEDIALVRGLYDIRVELESDDLVGDLNDRVITSTLRVGAGSGRAQRPRRGAVPAHRPRGSGRVRRPAGLGLGDAGDHVHPPDAREDGRVALERHPRRRRVPQVLAQRLLRDAASRAALGPDHAHGRLAAAVRQQRGAAGLRRAGPGGAAAGRQRGGNRVAAPAQAAARPRRRRGGEGLLPRAPEPQRGPLSPERRGRGPGRRLRRRRRGARRGHRVGAGEDLVRDRALSRAGDSLLQPRGAAPGGRARRGHLRRSRAARRFHPAGGPRRRRAARGRTRLRHRRPADGHRGRRLRRRPAHDALRRRRQSRARSRGSPVRRRCAGLRREQVERVVAALHGHGPAAEAVSQPLELRVPEGRPAVHGGPGRGPADADATARRGGAAEAAR